MTPESMKDEVAEALKDANEENAKLWKRNTVLEAQLQSALETIEIGLDFVEQCKSQGKNIVWPGEIDSFEERARSWIETHKRQDEESG